MSDPKISNGKFESSVGYIWEPEEVLAKKCRWRVARAEERIRAATFTNGSSDKERVVKLYRDYVERVEAVLTKSVEFIEEVKGVPVLLSILVLIFKHLIDFRMLCWSSQ